VQLTVLSDFEFGVTDAVATNNAIVDAVFAEVSALDDPVWKAVKKSDLQRIAEASDPADWVADMNAVHTTYASVSVVVKGSGARARQVSQSIVIDAVYKSMVNSCGSLVTDLISSLVEKECERLVDLVDTSFKGALIRSVRENNVELILTACLTVAVGIVCLVVMVVLRRR
jgi:hypothetical protein